MGPTASTVWYVDSPDPAAVLRDHPEPDAEAAHALAGQLFPEMVALPTYSGSLSTSAAPAGQQIFIGSYPGVTVVCSPTLMCHRPSMINESWTRPLASEHTYLICAETSTPWGAFAHWERGALRRSFSATASVIHENVGLPLVWERPFWAGEHPAPHPLDSFPDPLSLPFHPGEFADAANSEWFGFGYAEHTGENPPVGITVCGFTLYAAGEEPPGSPSEPEVRGLRRWWRRLAG